jgi:hypothetical protein
MVGYGISAVPKVLDGLLQARSLPRVRLLWVALRPLAPDLELGWGQPRPESSDVRAPLRMWASLRTLLSVRQRNYRRVIEVRDWLNRLRSYLDPRVEQIAQRHAEAIGLDGEQRDAAVEAARIAAALRAWRADQRPRVLEVGTWREPGPSRVAQLRMMVAIANAFAAPSPVVSATLDEMDAQRDSAVDTP